MILRFCPKCKTLLSPQKKKGEIFLVCNNCSFFKKAGKSLIAGEKIKAEEERGEGVLPDENVFAIYKHKCKKCGYDKAQILDLGTFYTDEDTLIMLQCGKCGYSERIGRKTS